MVERRSVVKKAQATIPGGSKTEDCDSGVNLPAVQLCQLPSFEEFIELIDGDAPIRASSCARNYSVYHKYSDGAAW